MDDGEDRSRREDTNRLGTARAENGVTQLWIDRELSVVLRMQTPDLWTDGVDIQHVDELTLGPVDPIWFDVPEDVESGAQ
jgi:hypothetical protein